MSHESVVLSVPSLADKDAGQCFDVPDQLWHLRNIKSIESTCKMLPTSSKLSTSSPSGHVCV